MKTFPIGKDTNQGKKLLQAAELIESVAGEIKGYTLRDAIEHEEGNIYHGQIADAFCDAEIFGLLNLAAKICRNNVCPKVV